MQVECWYPLNHNRGDVSNETNPAHIQENINIFDFALTDEEMAAIRAIDLGEGGRSFNLRYGDMNFGAFQDYPYDPTARK